MVGVEPPAVTLRPDVVVADDDRLEECAPTPSAGWVDELAALIATDLVRARTELRKRFDVDLELMPLPSDGPGRWVQLRGA